MKENIIRPDTVGQIEDIQANADMLPRGQYTLNIKPQDLPSAGMKPAPAGLSMSEYEAVFELYQARDAAQIAKSGWAQRYAADTFQKAEQHLSEAESQYSSKADPNTITNTARQAVQAASDARARLHCTRKVPERLRRDGKT